MPIPSSRSVGGRAVRGSRASPRSTTAISIASGAESLTRVFVDTSAFYALEDASDRHHREARAIQRWYLSHRPRLFTTHHVLDESVTLIGVRLRPARAVRFARLLLASRVVHVIRTDEAMEEAALNVYERLDDARLSFTDCVSFAVMRALEIPVAFAFDRDFERAGFRLVRGGGALAYREAHGMRSKSAPLRE